ncbi:ExeM/NucH family extracellular endonuclease [Geminocystis sp. NIES-3709]|uniref:ExeM/NucH family extracellular endonuclease n=1 Tax=Geminocystis sp. NIES-3709 TaxID=1617448 RepID=UPI0005FCD143|nr:ExeM/NucH family extracellular endonuclease [Geminocystis sp. NIES-3709]BAQ65373.1 alkaline phosphatase [Geminocystis sp. NIES-3709]
MAKIIINEFYRGGNLTTTDEFIELLLLEDLTATQLETFFVGDSTGTKASKFSAYEFTNMSSIATTFKAGTIIVVGGTGRITQDTSYDPTNNDWNIALNAGGSFLPNANSGNSGDIAGDDIVWVDTSNTGSTISVDGFAVDIGTATGTFFNAVNVDFGSSTNNTGYALNSNSSDITNIANWTTGIASASTTPGSPNGGTNTTFIDGLRNPAPSAEVIINETGGSTNVTEVGATDSYTIVLSDQPTSNVSININSGSQLTTISNVLTFTPQNWNIAQLVTVTAVDDAVVEGNHSGTIQHSVTSSDSRYNGLSINPINVSITDNDSAIAKIHEVQGSGSDSPLVGQTVTIEGVVIADFQLNNQLRGFFIQEENADRDLNSATSEGIFVFTGNTPPLDVQEGQIIRLTGTVSEFFNMTQITATTAGGITLVNAGNNLSLVTPEIIDLPVVGDVNSFYEQYEGMLITYANKMYVSEYFEMARYGQIVLTADGRPYQYTHTDNTPTSAEYNAFLDDLARKRIILDDDDNTQNSPLSDGVGKIFYPQPNGLSTGTQGTNYFRGGDTVSNLTGVLHWSFAGQSGTDAWRMRPTQANPITFTPENPRPANPPSVGGNIKVASFNVLNYFNTIDTVGGNGSPRGADSVDEFNRQNEKLISALIGLDADVIGLMEIENNGDATTPAVKELVDRLNAQLGSSVYRYINTGLVGTDQITVAFIYKISVVTAKGNVAILDNTAFTDPNNTGQQRNRPAIAQTFEVIDNNNDDFGEAFNVVVNHLKSKGADGATGADLDQGNGQGAFNDTRTKASNYLVNTWIPSDPTGQGDDDFLIIGDLNAYKGETPITTIKNAGYTDLVESYNGNDTYGYVFDGQLGYLDYALSNGSMTSQVTGVAEWHINADEISLFDYNNTVDDGAGEASFEAKPNGNNLYEANAFRTSDHDPVIIGLNLAPPPNIQITEFIYSGANGEFIEFTNLGTIAVDMTGWSFDDDSRTSGSFSLTSFGTVQAGESIILTESDANTFRTAWGLDASVKVIGNLTQNLGRNDEINLYDNNGTLIDRLTYGDQTFTGTVRTQNASAWAFEEFLDSQTITNNWVLSAVNDAQSSYASTGGDIGNPGGYLPVLPPAPTIEVDTATTNNFLDGGVLNLLPISGSGAISGVINDPTDPALVYGIDFTIDDPDTAVGGLTVTVSSSNQSVVSNSNLNLTGSGANRNLKITPNGVGLTTITLTVSDGTNNGTYIINYGASVSSLNPTTTRFLTGISDASSAIAIDNDYMFVANDEDQTIRLFDRNNSGLPVNAFDFTSSLGLSGNSEVDIEASTQLGNIIYWMGSHSNNSEGLDRPNRERIFATQINGTGANTTLTFQGYYQFLEDDMIAWDNNNGHGLGAGFLGLANSASAGVIPESSALDGFNIEGLTFAPDNTTAYVSFRAPNLPTTNRNQALIVPVTNFTSLLGASTGSTTFGTPIFLDLGGRGIRSIERNSNNEYLIVAGPADGATGTAPKDFRLYTWTGNPSDAPVIRSSNLTGLMTDGSFESIVTVPNNLNSTSQIELLVDNGDTIWYNNGVISKDLAQDNLQKFRREIITLGGVPLNNLKGTGRNDTLIGESAQNIIIGGGGNDFLMGNSIQDTLDGGSGNDTLIGGNGNDIILAGSGNDILVGGMGNDTLTGGSGQDFFRFNSPTEEIDRITDFNVVYDSIELSSSGFGLSMGALNSTQFFIGATASTINNRLIYDRNTGNLFFDDDGNGGNAQVQIGTLNPRLALTHQDFIVI